MTSTTRSSARWLIIFLIAILGLVAPSPAPAQADRWKSTPTGWWWLTDATEAEVNARVAAGFRVINIEIESTSPYRFAAIFVRNSGVHYEPTWGWWYDKTAAEVDEIVNGQPVRLIDIEVYSVSGQTRHAIVIVGNSGPSAKSSSHFTNRTWDEVGTLLGEHTGRLIDLDTRLVSGVRKFDGIMIANTGADNDAWWRYSGGAVDAAYITTKLAEHDARLVDIERRDGDTFTVVMQKTHGELWWWYLDQTEAQVNALIESNGARLIDIESRQTANGRRFDVIMLNNSNALSTKVGNAGRLATDGAIGFGLKVVGGPMLASINLHRKHYPASMIKIMQHIHAMRWAATNVNPAAPFAKLGTVLQVYDGSCDNSGDVVATSLSTAMQRMMQNSDNDDTNAIQDFFGRPAINATMQNVLGLSADTVLANRLGCGGGNLADPANSATVADLLKTYEAIATGVIHPQYLPQFWSLMNSELNVANGTYRTIIDEEAADLGLSGAQKTAFLDGFRWIAKAGGWTDANGDKFTTNAGLMFLPRQTCAGVSTRGLVFSTFIDKYTVLDPAFSFTRMMFTGEIRAALRTFKFSSASQCFSGLGFVPVGVDTTIDAAARDGKTMTFRFGPGTFEEDTGIEFHQVTSINPPAGLRLVPGMSVDLQTVRDGNLMPGLQPGRPVTMELDLQFPVNEYAESSLQLFTRESPAQPWINVTESCPDAAVIRYPRTHRLLVEVCHFSQFAVFGVPNRLAFLPLAAR